MKHLKPSNYKYTFMRNITTQLTTTSYSTMRNDLIEGPSYFPDYIRNAKRT